MAKVKSLLDLSGELYNVVFCKRNDKIYARKSTSLEGDRWWRHRRLERTREKAIEFGGASQLAADIRGQIPAPIRKLCHHYAHNQLVGAIREACNAHRRQADEAYPGRPTRFLSAFSAQGTANAIPGIQLGNARGHTAPTATIHSQPATIGDNAGLRIVLHGLHNHACGHYPVSPGTKREFRIHVCFAIIGDFHRNPHASRRRAAYVHLDGSNSMPLIPVRSADWAPASAIDPIFDTIDLPLIQLPGSDSHRIPAPQPGQQLLVFVAVEWRDRTGKRIKLLKELSSFQGLAAIPCTAPDEEDISHRRHAKSPAARRRPSRRANPRPLIRHRSPNKPIPHPRERLMAALRALAPPQ